MDRATGNEAKVTPVVGTMSLWFRSLTRTSPTGTSAPPPWTGVRSSLSSPSDVGWGVSLVSCSHYFPSRRSVVGPLPLCSPEPSGGGKTWRGGAGGSGVLSSPTPTPPPSPSPRTGGRGDSSEYRRSLSVLRVLGGLGGPPTPPPGTDRGHGETPPVCGTPFVLESHTRDPHCRKT